jgi:hypothetical protein
MNNVNTLAANDDDVLSSTGVEAKVNVNVNVNVYPLFGLVLAILSGVISIGAGYLVYMLLSSN